MTSSPARSARLFSRPYEEINLAFALGLIALAIGEWVAGGHVSDQIRLFSYLGVTVFIGASGHIGFTLALLLQLPEAKEWVKLKTENRPHVFWLKVAGVFFISFIFALLAFDLLMLSGLKLLNIAYIFLLADWFLVYHHSITQTHGLMIAYHQQAAKAGMPPLEPHIEARNKLLIKGILLCTFIVPFTWTLNLNGTLPDYVKGTMFTVSLTCVCIYWFQNFRRYRSIQRNQVIFSLRMFLFPLTAVTFFAGMGYRGVHAVEYLMVYGKFFERSKQKPPLFGLIAISLLIFLFFTGLGLFAMAKDNSYVASLFGSEGGISSWIKLFAAVNAGCTFTHYYMDRQIFRMRDASSRKIFGSLLST